MPPDVLDRDLAPAVSQTAPEHATACPQMKRLAEFSAYSPLPSERLLKLSDQLCQPLKSAATSGCCIRSLSCPPARSWQAARSASTSSPSLSWPPRSLIRAGTWL